MTYIPASETQTGTARVIYESKDGRSSKTFDALDWLAQLTTHIPNRREQMVRYAIFLIAEYFPALYPVNHYML